MKTKLSKANFIKSIIIGILTLILIFVIVIVIASRESEDEKDNGTTPVNISTNGGVTTKQETVYVNLDSAGKSESVIINIGSQENKKLEEKSIPWNISAKYFFDGNECLPKNIIGKSGKFEMKIAVKENKEYKGSASFYEYFAIQISFTANSDVFLSPKEENGSIAEVGKNANVNFICLPTMSGDFTFTSKVENFEMPDINIAANPYSMDIEGMVDLDLLLTASKNLSDGADEIYKSMKKNSQETLEQLNKMSNSNSISSDGIEKLKAAARELKSGASKLNKGIKKMQNGTETLKKAYSHDANLQAYFAGVEAVLLSQNTFNIGVVSFTDSLITALSNLGTTDLSKMLSTYKKRIEEMPAAFLEYKKGMNEFNDSIQKIKDNNLISGEWKPISFATDKEVNKVLFVMKIKGSAKEEKKTEKPEEKEISLLEKIKNLFT
ncbi:MAG: hypothetical protein LBD41_01575 [Clostridiales Family XIII bacterium]|jgi:X-X-X-Leu-X-X-Gly heptad repeat protein|nr:hypothetical protein [Clostridiales Family XIII bacterium]